MKMELMSSWDTIWNILQHFHKANNSTAAWQQREKLSVLLEKTKIQNSQGAKLPYELIYWDFTP